MLKWPWRRWVKLQSCSSIAKLKLLLDIDATTLVAYKCMPPLVCPTPADSACSQTWEPMPLKPVLSVPATVQVLPCSSHRLQPQDHHVANPLNSSKPQPDCCRPFSRKRSYGTVFFCKHAYMSCQSMSAANGHAPACVAVQALVHASRQQTR